MEGACGSVELQLEIARLEHLAVLIPEHRQRKLAVDTPRARLPVDVEESGVGAEWSPLQNVQPPGIVGAHAHVVRHEVEQQPHVVGAQFGDQGLERRVVAEFRIEAVEVDDVVAVGRARARHGEWGGVHMTYAERGEIRHDPAGIIEPEVLMELQPVSRARHAGWGHG